MPVLQIDCVMGYWCPIPACNADRKVEIDDEYTNLEPGVLVVRQRIAAE